MTAGSNSVVSFLSLYSSSFGVVVRRVLELNVERSGVLADAHHLDRGLGKQPGVTDAAPRALRLRACAPARL